MGVSGVEAPDESYPEAIPGMTLPLFDSYREIPLTQGQVALVSIEDYPAISQHKWYAKWYPGIKGFYAQRHVTRSPGKQDSVLMHRVILGLEKGDPREGEHKEQSHTLDNRRENLRIATTAENQRNQRRNVTNKTGFKGVHQRPNGKFRVDIRIDGRKRTIGSSYVAAEAARIYDRAALKHFGEFAHINFPRSDYELNRSY